MTATEQTTRQIFNRLKSFYDRSWDPINQTLHIGIFQKKNDDLFEAFNQATEYLLNKLTSVKPITNQSHVLDIGCGNGKTVLDICSQFNCEGLGVDISDAQIAQACQNLKSTNALRTAEGLLPIKCKFVRATASQLSTKVSTKKFTHIVSQDAILLVANKKRLFRDIGKMLSKDGAIAIADFITVQPKTEFTAQQASAIFKLVNWTKALTLDQYLNLLEKNGLAVNETQKRSSDMVRTYRALIKQLDNLRNKDKTYNELKNRYQNIVQAVRAQKMSWLIIIATKKS